MSIATVLLLLLLSLWLRGRSLLGTRLDSSIGIGHNLDDWSGDDLLILLLLLHRVGCTDQIGSLTAWKLIGNLLVGGAHR